MSAATMNEMERLRAERDAYREAAHGMSADLTTIGEERNALAAHVERLEDIIERSTLADSPAAESALEDTPETSLARLKAKWQADQTEQIREMCEGLTGSQIRSALDGLLAGLRHRAKEEK